MITLKSKGQTAAYARYLGTLPDDLAHFLPDLGEESRPRSVLALALEAARDDEPRRLALNEIRDRCLFNAAVTKEACVSVSRLMTPNWKGQLVTVTAVRMALEAAGLVAWLLAPGLHADQRIARYLARAEDEAKQGRTFLSLAIRDAAHLKEELVAVGERSLRPARDARDELKVRGIQPAAMLEPAALAAQVEDEAIYRAFSAVVHASTAGIKEFNEIVIDRDKQAGFFMLLIELTARAHAVIAVRVHEYVRGAVTDDFSSRLDLCARRLGVDPVRLRPEKE